MNVFLSLRRNRNVGIVLARVLKRVRRSITRVILTINVNSVDPSVAVRLARLSIIEGVRLVIAIPVIV